MKIFLSDFGCWRMARVGALMGLLWLGGGLLSGGAASASNAAPVPVPVPVPVPIPRAVPVSTPLPMPNPLPAAPEPVEAILRLQLFLDAMLFGPGKVDGRPGEFTTKALKRYQHAMGLPESEVEGHSLDLSSVRECYALYTIRPEDLKFVGALPLQPAAQSKLKYLPYDSLLEFLTERFHCSPELLAFINKPLKMGALKPGDVVKVPAVKEPFLIEELTEVASLPEVPEFLPRVIKIDTREKILNVLEGEKLLASLPITPGSGYLATPPGNWRIVGIAQLPTFRWDKSVLEYGVRSGNFYQLPIGPNNPVGVMWIGLNKPGIGIHGTNQPQTIGRSSSHGCMRTANWDVVRLSKLITKGMTVTIEGPEALPRPVVAETAVVRRAEAAGAAAAGQEEDAQAQAQGKKRKFLDLFFWRK